MKNIDWTTEEEELLIREIKEGNLNRKAISALIGRTHSAVVSKIKVLRENGRIPPSTRFRNKRMKLQRFSTKEKKIISEMFAANIPAKQIADELNRSYSGVCTHIQKHLKEKKKKPKPNTTKEEPSSLAGMLNALGDVPLTEGEGISLQHKEMLIEILHKVIV